MGSHSSNYILDYAQHHNVDSSWNQFGADRPGSALLVRSDTAYYLVASGGSKPRVSGHRRLPHGAWTSSWNSPGWQSGGWNWSSLGWHEWDWSSASWCGVRGDYGDPPTWAHRRYWVTAIKRWGKNSRKSEKVLRSLDGRCNRRDQQCRHRTWETKVKKSPGQ